MDERTPRERSPEQAPDPANDTASTETMAPSIGDGSLLKERYWIVRELSRGGFGKVFLAHDRQLHDRPVVIKIQLDHPAGDPWFERKFSEEARALALIDHPGVVGVLDNGRTDDGKLFLVMQFIEGSTLRAVLTPEGLPLDRVASLIQQIGQALGAAHEKRVWHRDLKPENIMLQMLSGGDERARLIDFGISSIAEFTVKQTRVAGSLAYMAPEQVSGQPSAGTDIYTFGVIAYEMLTGRKPFAPEHAAQLAELQRAGVRVNPSALRPAISQEAEKLILRSLSYNPHERPASAREFGDSLSRALLATPPAQKERGTRRRTGIWSAVAAAAVILASLGVWIYRGRAVALQQIPAAAAVQAPVPAPEQKPEATQKSDGGSADARGDRLFWSSINSSDDPRAFREYLAKYPYGEFASLARLKLQPRAAAQKSVPAEPAGQKAISKAVIPEVAVPAGSNSSKADAVSSNPRHNPEPEADDKRASAAYTEGYRLFGPRGYSEAIARFTEAIRLKPDYFDAYRLRGISYYWMGNYEKALTDLSEAIRLKPDVLAVYIFRGNSYNYLKQYRLAQQDATEAIRIDPQNSSGFKLLGKAYSNQQEYNNALQAFNEAIRLSGSRSNAYQMYIDRGDVYSHIKQYDRAIQDYTEAIRLKPDDIEAYNSRGFAKDMLGDTTGAAADRRYARELQKK